MPDYHDGVWPLGGWEARTLGAPIGWTTSMDLKYDMGALVLDVNFNGVLIADATGSQGMKFKSGYLWSGVLDFGYPTDLMQPYRDVDENQLRYCVVTTTLVGSDSNQSAGKQQVNCDMGHGSSGGPWLLPDDTTTWAGWLIGNTSNHPGNDNSDEVWSPYFGDAAINLYNSTSVA